MAYASEDLLLLLPPITDAFTTLHHHSSSVVLLSTEQSPYSPQRNGGQLTHLDDVTWDVDVSAVSDPAYIR